MADLDKRVSDAMAAPADEVLSEMAHPIARRAAVTIGVKDDVVAHKEIYRAVVQAANGYAKARELDLLAQNEEMRRWIMATATGISMEGAGITYEEYNALTERVKKEWKDGKP